MTAEETPTQLLIVGSGPAGGTAATVAAALGAAVTLAEDSVVGGAAHLLDCVPSKAMVASAMRLHAISNASRLGIAGRTDVAPDMSLLSARADQLSGSLAAADTQMLESQGVELLRGRAAFTGPDRADVSTEEGTIEVTFDHALIATGSSPWIPEWADVDGDRIISTRHAYHLPAVPEHVVVIGSGVTGVEFVHIFSALGSRVTLLVSRHQVLPHRDPEVAAVLEEDFLERGVRLLKGSRADGARRDGDGVVVTTEDGRTVEASHALLAVGSVPNSSGLGLEEAGVDVDERGHVLVDEHQRTSASHIYAAGDVTGQMPLSSVAALQGRAVARHVMGLATRPMDYAHTSHAIFTEPEIASVGLEEVEAASMGRKVRITKMPFAANSRAQIQGNPRGFVKVISDPATRIVLGGTIVGHHASELIPILALAAKERLTVDAVAETLMVYPSLAESLMEAAD